MIQSAQRYLTALPVQLVLILSLLAANMQCLARCTGQPCENSVKAQGATDESKVPPCHRGKQEKKDTPQAPCKYSVLVADTVRGTDVISVSHLNYTNDALPSSLVLANLSLQAERFVRYDGAPALLPPELTFSTVLRL